MSAVVDRALHSRAVPAKVVHYVSRRMTAMPHEYSPVVVCVSDLAMLIVTIAAVAQRDGFFPPSLALLGGLITLAPMASMLLLIDFVPSKRGMLTVHSAGAIIGASLILLEPAHADVAPFTFVLIVGEIAAMSSVRISLLVAALALTALAVPALLGNLEFAPVYIMMTALGWLVGFIVRTQSQLLEQERVAQRTRAEQAASEERRRILREVHDVVAHSLSVTMLHLTAARRALQEDGDSAEAIEALVDAERLGRQAMGDIRRTVDLLRAGPADQAPKPGIADIESLVADFSHAGLPVHYVVRGEAAPVSPTVELCLYRIVQESLANVAKQAPGARTHVTLNIGPTGSTLTIENELSNKGALQQRQGGSGLVGMRQRAQLVGGRLAAGRTRSGWRVRAEIPHQGDNSGIDHECIFGGER
ncbi:MAG: hypothetical protein ICV72_05830 [Aldersonia sp.]|nr:hypothetical protein [Aldersonia sp.]